MAGFKTYQELLDFLEQNSWMLDADFVLDEQTNKEKEIMTKAVLRILDSPRVSRNLQNKVYDKYPGPGIRFLAQEILYVVEFQHLSPAYQLKLVKNPLYDITNYWGKIQDYILNLTRNKRVNKQPISIKALEISIKKDSRDLDWWLGLIIKLQDLASRGKFPGFVK